MISTRLALKSFQRALRTKGKSYSTQFATRKFEEIKISVPWGHVSGKWYGPKDVRPIVGLHGWQENAGTFDTIAPFLPSHVGFLAIDLPGHGRSSWLPEGCIYHTLDHVILMFNIMRELNWDKISMLCHSMSATNGFVFGSLFPDKCDMLIGLDIVKPVVLPKDILIYTLRERIEAFKKSYEFQRSKVNPPSYDFDQLVQNLYHAAQKSINIECCQFILNRSIQKSAHDPHKYYFSRDSRVKSIMLKDLPQHTIVEMAGQITCPFLFIKSSEGPYFEDKANYDEVISVLTKKPNFEYHQVEGTHHVHLNEPKKVADIINPFINKLRPK